MDVGQIAELEGPLFCDGEMRVMRRLSVDLNLYSLSLGCCPFIVYRFWQAEEYLMLLGLGEEC